ncbi:MAG: undecaprenyl-diphosphate phosphatase [Candidatus Nomurabacteria bacterium]|jgi:undecaprenyl-diphosphatase|nr:undecaprenyl-diphosphate phosphatase [Candidatus Nomurabacteria bacterium]
MTIWLAIIYGVVQGLTEFIPVSSSGHLALAQDYLAGGVDHLFVEMINLGTLLALLVAFRKKIWQIITDVFARKKWGLAINLLITAIPAGILGLTLSDFIANTSFFGHAAVVAIAMATVGLIMIFLNQIVVKIKAKPLEFDKIKKSQALVIGLSQSVALIPGVSRSGATIITGRLLGLNSHDAAEYSFLASIPLFLGVVAKGFLSSTDRAYWGENLLPLILGNLAAFIVGVIVIKYLLAYLQRKNSLRVFGIYRVALASVVLVALSLTQL